MKNYRLDIASLLLAALLAACCASLQAAPPGPEIVVGSADPDEALQGDELDVTISGTGFADGAVVSYLVSGTKDSSQIDVIRTDFVEDASGQQFLVTRIKIKDQATVSDYDILVQLGGRKGKGTTRFAVLPYQTPNDGLVQIVATGAVQLNVFCIESVNASTSFLGCNGYNGSAPYITLGQYFLDFQGYDKQADGNACFGGGQAFAGTVQLQHHQSGDAAIFRFWALNSAGDVDIQYALTIDDPHLGGWSDPPGFPPGVGETTTLIGTHWALGSYQRDKKYGPCTAAGEFSGADIVITDLTRLD